MAEVGASDEGKDDEPPEEQQAISFDEAGQVAAENDAPEIKDGGDDRGSSPSSVLLGAQWQNKAKVRLILQAL